MKTQVKVDFIQLSEKGEHELNQDATGYCSPTGSLESNKGHTAVVADGISTSPHSHVASQVIVRSLLEDYYSTPDIWSVKNSIKRVLTATNQWLYSQSRRQSNENRGYIASFACAVLKGRRIHVFHAGDCRIYRLRNNELQCLTEDHRYWPNPDTHLLARAIGMQAHLEMDYQCFEVLEKDIYILSSDGVHDVLTNRIIADCLNRSSIKFNDRIHELLQQSNTIGNRDDRSLVGISIQSIELSHDEPPDLPVPPLLDSHKTFDGHRIIKQLYSSDRSHLYLAESKISDRPYVIKIPARSQANDHAFLQDFMHEEWVCRRLDHKHIIQIIHYPQRKYLYLLFPYIEGQTLKHYMDDFGPLALYQTRQIIVQLASALQSIHRKEMLHQDVRPSNIMLDKNLKLTLIDLASCQVTSLQEGISTETSIKGTLAYTAPEVFLYEQATAASDVFSVGVIFYEMLTGRLPYGQRISQINRSHDLNKLSYTSIKVHDPQLPIWLDNVLRKALHPKVQHRYQEVSELVYDLNHNRKQEASFTSLADANPTRFWQGLSALLAAGLLCTLYLLEQV